MDCRVFEAQRLLRRANEINPEAAALAIKALQQFSDARLVNPAALYYTYQAVPPETDKERKSA
jgi:hypothetical protein